MRAPHRVIAIALLIVGAGAVPLERSSPGTVRACGPIVSFPVFTPVGAPDHASYFAGDLGILQPTYARRYLLVAWRTLNGRPLTNGEQQAFAPAPAMLVDPVQAWLQTRKTVPYRQWSNYLGRETRVAKTYTYIVNCGDSAFLTAAKTLEARRAALGGTSPEVAAWAEAQDVVFSNCGRTSDQPPAIPAPLGRDASAQSRADRAYQIAAAQFYAGLFADAEASFTAISKDVSSPWRTWGSFLAARAAIRQGTMGGTEAEGDPAALHRAEEQLRAVLRDPSLSETHAPAEQLLDFIEARTRPNDALARAARALSAPDEPARFRAHLGTYEYLLNRFVNGDTEKLESGIANPRDATDLLDWVLTFQGHGEDGDAVASALDRLRTSGSPAWLVAALSKATPQSPKRVDVLNASASIDPASPAYPTVAFHRARLLLLSGEAPAARDVLDRALEAPHLPKSTVNLFSAARLATARTFEEYLNDASRVPVDASNGAPAAEARAIDQDVTRRLERAAPLIDDPSRREELQPAGECPAGCRSRGLHAGDPAEPIQDDSCAPAGSRAHRTTARGRPEADDVGSRRCGASRRGGVAAHAAPRSTSVRHDGTNERAGSARIDGRAPRQLVVRFLRRRSLPVRNRLLARPDGRAVAQDALHHPGCCPGSVVSHRPTSAARSRTSAGS